MKTSGITKRVRYLLTGLAVLALGALLLPNAPATRAAAGCSGTITPAVTEGPYYKAGSPERTDLLEAGIPGTKLVITGYVYDRNCQPIAGAWLDFWQADGNGQYDNSGYKLRGHQFTDA